MLDSLRTYLSRIDERPVEQIDRDIDDELATHIALLEDHLIQSGLSPAAARETALSRFGNPQSHKRRCRDVALMERRMKTYAQIIVTIACGLLLGAVTTSIWFNQQSANAALAGMSSRIDELSQSLSTRTPAPQPSTATSYNNVFITGTPVSRPGQYAMPMDGLTLRRLMATAGVNTKFVKEITVRHSPKFTDGGTERLSAAALADVTGPDIDLKNDDLVTVVEVDR
jgi:hypothetical protein